MTQRFYIFSWLLLISILFPGCINVHSNTRTVVQAEPAPVSIVMEKTTKPKMQVVFLLDATGSMSGLIGTAKEKIWSIAGSLTQTEPAPDIEIGMVFYRDRGDAFITRHIPLGTAMDDLYEQLMAIRADGGGDTPESVNQALYEGLTKMKWDSLPGTYRAVFLVGDCPPHMDYRNDVKYPESCVLANKKNITINTILMGNDSEAMKIWKEIAMKTNGEFIQTDMRVNNITVKSPYDDKISELQQKLDKTRIYYGSSKAMAEQKMVQSEKIGSGDASINARRAEYNVSSSGKASYYGRYELVNDVIDGKKLSDIPASDLPKNLQKMPADELRKYVDSQIAERKRLESEIVRLSRQRQEYIDAELKKMNKDKVDSSFDDVIFNAVQSQAGKNNIKIEGKAKR